MAAPRGTLDSEALRIYLHRLGVSVDEPFHAGIRRWARAAGTTIEPVGAERRGRSTVALWPLDTVVAILTRPATFDKAPDSL